MRIGTALLTAACIISGIVVIEAHSAYAAEAPLQNTPQNTPSSEDLGAGADEAPPLPVQ